MVWERTKAFKVNSSILFFSSETIKRRGQFTGQLIGYSGRATGILS
jgi:hypothetical protein